MPIYEFSCKSCGARVSLFFRSMNAEVKGNCDRCGSADLQRLISKVAIIRPPVDISQLDKREMLDGVDFGNPTSMANFFKRMGDTFQDDQNDYMEEIVGRLEHGEDVAQTLGVETHDHSHESTGADSGGGEE